VSLISSSLIISHSNHADMHICLAAAFLHPLFPLYRCCPRSDNFDQIKTRIAMNFNMEKSGIMLIASDKVNIVNRLCDLFIYSSRSFMLKKFY
jgi:hypothetical protein